MNYCSGFGIKTKQKKKKKKRKEKKRKALPYHDCLVCLFFSLSHIFMDIIHFSPSHIRTACSW
jgi:hypothetical protein